MGTSRVTLITQADGQREPLASVPHVRNICNLSDMLSARPLTGTPADQETYVRRPADERVDGALGNGMNVLLRARRGAGATSMLNRVEYELPDAVLVDGGHATSSEQVLQAVAARAHLPRRFAANIAEMVQRLDPLAPPGALRELRSALTEQKRRIFILLDGPLDPGIAHALFGQHRDAARPRGCSSHTSIVPVST